MLKIQSSIPCAEKKFFQDDLLQWEKRILVEKNIFFQF